MVVELLLDLERQIGDFGHGGVKFRIEFSSQSRWVEDLIVHIVADLRQFVRRFASDRHNPVFGVNLTRYRILGDFDVVFRYDTLK